MSDRYQKTSYYWNDLYEQMPVYDPRQPLDDAEMESALNWLSEQGGTILDFGCGSGQVLLRCLEKGASRTIGVDLSFHAISLSRRSAATCYESLRTKWIWGDVKSLHQLPDMCVSGILLKDVLFEVFSDELPILASELERLLDAGGRLLLQNALAGDEMASKAETASEALIKRHFDVLACEIFTDASGNRYRQCKLTSKVNNPL